MLIRRPAALAEVGSAVPQGSGCVVNQPKKATDQPAEQRCPNPAFQERAAGSDLSIGEQADVGVRWAGDWNERTKPAEHEEQPGGGASAYHQARNSDRPARYDRVRVSNCRDCHDILLRLIPYLKPRWWWQTTNCEVIRKCPEPSASRNVESEHRLGHCGAENALTSLQMDAPSFT
jgi:hypothetical protein